MRFLVQVGQQEMDFAALREFALAMEAAGFDGLYLYDHLLPISPPDDAPCLEAWSCLAALAATTRRLTIGTLVGAVTLRPPGLLAKIAATVDAISEGRVEIGLGTAWYEREHRAFGAPFPPIRERLDCLEEQCEVLRPLLRGERVHHAGAHYQLDGAVVRPAPKHGSIPLVIGARGERRALRIVARHADVWNASGASPDAVRARREVLDAHCTAVGRQPSEIATSALVPFDLLDDPAAVLRALEALAAARGSTPEEVGAAALIGTRDELAARIDAFRAAGVRDLVLMAGRPLKRAALERLAKEVLPAAR
jgi:F420-dependent oxidoreductase-like protein